MRIGGEVSRAYRRLFFVCYQEMKKSWSYVDNDPWLGGVVILSLSEVSNLIVVSYLLHDVFHLNFIKLTKPIGYGLCMGLILLNYLVLIRRGALRRILAEFAEESQGLAWRNTLLFYGYFLLTLILLIIVPYATSHFTVN